MFVKIFLFFCLFTVCFSKEIKKISVKESLIKIMVLEMENEKKQKRLNVKKKNILYEVITNQ